jgi:hypothetical protein
VSEQETRTGKRARQSKKPKARNGLPISGGTASENRTGKVVRQKSHWQDFLARRKVASCVLPEKIWQIALCHENAGIALCRKNAGNFVLPENRGGKVALAAEKTPAKVCRKKARRS